MAGHTPDGLGNDCDGNKLKTVQQAKTDWTLQRARAIGEQYENNRRGQREARPGRETTEVTRPHKTQGKTDLAAGRTGKKLAKAH
jgi:hypothetical protein